MDTGEKLRAWWRVHGDAKLSEEALLAHWQPFLEGLPNPLTRLVGACWYSVAACRMRMRLKEDSSYKAETKWVFPLLGRVLRGLDGRGSLLQSEECAEGVLALVFQRAQVVTVVRKGMKKVSMQAEIGLLDKQAKEIVEVFDGLT